MSSSPEMTQSPVTSSQVVAIAMTYELLFRAVQLPIVVLISLAVVLRASYFVFDTLTGEHTLIALILTGTSTIYAQGYIRRIAPSPKDAQEGLAKVRILLPLGAFLLVCAFCRMVLGPFGNILQIRWILTWSPLISWPLTLRAVVFCLAMGLSVVLRYVGPPSVMRCSSCPLLEHPLQTSLRTLISNLTAERLIQLLTAPSSNNQQMMQPMVTSSPSATPWDYRGKARRFQTPMLMAMTAQIFLTAMFSLIAAYTSILPIFSKIHGETTPDKASLVLTCLAASLWHLTQTSLQFPEVDPLRLRGRLDVRYPTTESLMTHSFLVVGCAVLATTWFNQHQYNDYEGDTPLVSFKTWPVLATCLITGCGIYAYLDIFDRFVQHMICNYGKDIHQVVFEATDDRSNDALLEIALQILAHSDPILIQCLAEPSARAYADLERHEVQRHDHACQIMGGRLLSQSHETSAPLEEDVLRLALLAHYGAGRDILDISELTKSHIKQWIESPDTNGHWQVSRGGEPPVVSLVRAISAYIGGLGESLLICSKRNDTGSQNRLDKSPWIVAPGTVACATYAVRAGARFLLSNGQSSFPMGRLTMLIPVFLSGLHTLECSLIQWARNVVGATAHREARDMFQKECPEFWPIYVAIAEASMAILEALPSREVIQLRHLSPDCSRWVGEIYSKISVHGRSSPRSVVPTIGY